MDVADKINKGENVKILHGSTMPSWICRVRTSKLVGGGRGFWYAFFKISYLVRGRLYSRLESAAYVKHPSQFE